MTGGLRPRQPCHESHPDAGQQLQHQDHPELGRHGAEEMGQPGCHQPDLVDRLLRPQQSPRQKRRGGESAHLECRQEAGGAEPDVELSGDLGNEKRGCGESEGDGPGRGENPRRGLGAGTEESADRCEQLPDHDIEQGVGFLEGRHHVGGLGPAGEDEAEISIGFGHRSQTLLRSES